MYPIHHGGSIVFCPLGVSALSRGMHFRRVIAFALTMRVKCDRKIGHDGPWLRKQVVRLSGLGSIQFVHATV